MEAQDVIYAAQKIMPYLDEPQRQAVQSLLARAERGEKVDNFLIDELRKNPDIRRWLANVLGVEERGEETMMAVDPPPGDVGTISAPLYVCPHGDFEWEVRRAGQPIPLCPVHKVPLVPAEDTGENR